MALPSLLVAGIAAVIWAVVVYARRRRVPAGSRPLPGPWGLPYIGRVHDVPEEASWMKFYEWSKEYGPIYQMEIFGSVHVWISSEQIAHDLLSKRAPIYSDRPMIPNLPDNRTSGDYLALQGNTATWKRQRRLCNQLMNASDRASLHDYPTRERDRFLYRFGQNPSDYVEHIEQYTSRTVARLSWGSAHPAEVLRETTFGLLETISPSGAVPNVIAFLRHIPAFLSPWKKKEYSRHELENKLLKSNVEFVKQQMAEDRAEPSFIRTFLESKTRDEKLPAPWDAMHEATYVVGQMAIAGALTIGSPIQSYFLAMCHYPQCQQMLQEEIDSVLGGRCPQWEDREKLPMLRAVVKEVIRWRPPVPTGIPHAIEKDDVYNGYFIPAGATIHALEWGITRNEDTYPDADTFNPKRWLEPAFPTYREPLTQHPNLNGFSQFGFGRRTCQGIPIVEQDLFLAFGGLAWAYHIRKQRDATGNEIPVHWNDFTPLLIAKPKRFQFDAVLRSQDKMETIRELHDLACDDEEERRTRKMEKEIGVVGQEAEETNPTTEKSGEILTADSDSDHDVLISIRGSSPEDQRDGSNAVAATVPKAAPTLQAVPGAWS